MLKKWFQQRRERKLHQLELVRHQISVVLSENNELRHNTELLARLNSEKTRLERKLGIVTV